MQVLDLIRFDPTRNCYVLKGNMQNYPPKWPDGTPKSTTNAFNWRAGATDTAFLKPKASNGRSKDLNSNGNVYAFSRASIDRIPYGRTKKLDDYSAKI